MKNLRIGVQIDEPTVVAAIAAIQQAEALGIESAWLTLGGARPDSLAIFAAAATRTERINLGTSIVPTFPRHPIALAQAARVVAELAPGRLRLGVGPSHKPAIEGALGIPFQSPLAHLREYLQVLKPALQQGGRLEYQGEYFRVQLDCGRPVDMQVLASGLRGKSFELIGELADGGISWVCPLHHIERVALPALAAGAARAGRARPAMIMHVAVCLHEDADAVLAASRQRFAFYPRLPFYSRMFVEAGFPEATAGTLSDRMVSAIVLSGSEEAVADQLQRIATAGVGEVLCSIVAAGADPAASAGRALRLLGELSRQD